MVAVGGDQQPRPVAALAVERGRPLEHGDPGPDRARPGRRSDVVALADRLHPVVEPTDHQRADRAHRRRRRGRPRSRRSRPRSTAAPTASAWRQRERHRRVDRDAERGRLLDRHEAGGRGRELDLEVRREVREPDDPARASGSGSPWSRSGSSGSTGDPCGRARGRRPGPRIAAPRTAISSMTCQVMSTSVAVGRSSAMLRGSRGRQTSSSLLQDLTDDGRVGRRADRAVGDRVLELGRGARIVPVLGRRGPGHPGERSFDGDGHGRSLRSRGARRYSRLARWPATTDSGVSDGPRDWSCSMTSQPE